MMTLKSCYISKKTVSNTSTSEPWSIISQRIPSMDHFSCCLTFVMYPTIICEHVLCSTRLRNAPRLQDWGGILADTGKPQQIEAGLRRPCSPSKGQGSAQRRPGINLVLEYVTNASKYLLHTLCCFIYLFNSISSPLGPSGSVWSR